MAAIAGPGASTSPARSTESSHTDGHEQHGGEQIGGEAAEKSRFASSDRKRAHAQQRRVDDGRGVRRQRAQKAPKPATAMAPHASVCASAQPHAGPRRGRARAPRSRSRSAPTRACRARRPLVAALVQDPHRPHDRDDADRDVDEEDQAPADLDEEAAERRAGGGCEPADRGPDADRAGALLGARTRAAAAPARSAAAMRRRAPARRARRRARRPTARAAERRAEREDREAADEDAFAAMPVGEPAGRDEQRCEHDRVGVQDPRESRRARAARSRPRSAGRRC